MARRSDAPITLAIIGAGNRGADAYGGYVLRHPEHVKVVAIADTSATRRKQMAERHGVPSDRVYASWEQLLAQPRLADAVILATPDHMHVAPALRALEHRYHILLEKPIAPTPDEMMVLADAVAGVAAGEGGRAGTADNREGRAANDEGCSANGEGRAAKHIDSAPTVTIAHVLRYTPFFMTLKRLLDEGRIGRLMTIQYTENIGYWHFAHSYVRGNWRRLDESSPMILAKSCHDLDMLRWLAGAPCRQVASFGGLSWFRRENMPEGAPPRCSDGCPVGDECAFNAVAFYVDGLADHDGWPVSVISTDTSREGRLQSVREGPYGRCVYQCDNDVVDQQVTALEFANGVTATFNVTGFTEENTRTLKLMGSGGEIRGHLDKGEIEIRTFGRPGFWNGSQDGRLRSKAPYETIKTGSGGGHAGGDDGLMEAFVERIRRHKAGDDPGEMRTSLAEALDSHFMAFAAEQSRTTGAVVTLKGEI